LGQWLKIHEYIGAETNRTAEAQSGGYAVVLPSLGDEAAIRPFVPPPIATSDKKMKKLPSPLVSVALLSASFTALTFTACSKPDRNATEAKVKDAYQDSKAAVTNAWDSVKSYTFEKRDDFSANAKALSSKMDAQISDLRANYSEAQASASRKAAMSELKSSEADYKEKVEALGHATAATWDSAKQNVIAAWDHLQAAYYKARAD